MSSDEGERRAVLARQLEMNKTSWRALMEHGVDESSELRLDFFYVAEGESEAHALSRFLRDSTDYDVSAESRKAGLLKKRWVVNGSTQPTSVSQEVLDQWVDWMVTAGFGHGCEFDGWGAQVP